jgi:adenylylsulfate kinase-like enzyme
VGGLTIFFTGLSGAGKSTLARAVGQRLSVLDGRVVRLLDGDALRQHLSSELGFSQGASKSSRRPRRIRRRGDYLLRWQRDLCRDRAI